MPGVITAGA